MHFITQENCKGLVAKTGCDRYNVFIAFRIVLFSLFHCFSIFAFLASHSFSFLSMPSFSHSTTKRPGYSMRRQMRYHRYQDFSGFRCCQEIRIF